IEHFNKFSKPYQRGAWRLLIFNKFSRHTTKQFLQYCKDNKIIPFRLPPHTSYKLQPLDLAAFQPYKHWHKRSVKLAIRSGCVDFNKVEFLYFVQEIRAKTFKQRTILCNRVQGINNVATHN
ncbi:hypothetical protein K469DRAFT_605737, partial [Zopfia rhizophila CBS 207.26]